MLIIQQYFEWTKTQQSCQVIHTSHRAHVIIVNDYIYANQPLLSSLKEKVFQANKKKLASHGGNNLAQNNNVLLTCTVQAKGESSLCLFMRRITRHRWELIFSVKYMASDPGCSAHMHPHTWKYTPHLLNYQNFNMRKILHETCELILELEIHTVLSSIEKNLCIHN